MKLRNFKFDISFHLTENAEDLTTELDEKAFRDAVEEDVKGALIEEFYGTELKDLTVTVETMKEES